MKNNKLILLVIYLLVFTFGTNADAQNYFKVELSIDPDLDKYNAMGLVLCRIIVINTDTMERTMAFDGVKDFQIRSQEDSEWTGIDDGSKFSYADWADVLFPLQPKDTFRLISNLSSLEYITNAFTNDPNAITKTYDCTIRVGVYCSTSDTTAAYIYSNEKIFSLTPLLEQDKKAFLEIIDKGLLPSFVAHPTRIYGFDSEDDELDAFILNQHPLSTFSSCVKLSKVHRKARSKVLTPEEKIELYQLLEEPLKSDYSYIKFMAQRAKNRIDSK